MPESNPAGSSCRWPGHENLTDAEREAYGCNPAPEPDACGHGDDPDEECDGCYG